jgi:hypothetical protein
MRKRRNKELNPCVTVRAEDNNGDVDKNDSPIPQDGEDGGNY